MGVSLPFFLALSAILFSIGLVGVLLRRSPLTILLSLEVMLNSVNLTLIAFSREVGGSDGQVFALIVMGIAAAEVVVGLGLVVAMTRREMVLDTDELRTLNG
jgi:NADH-quinone oxidoreductase subunit K